MLKTTDKYFLPVTTLLLAFLTAMSPFATDTYLSAMPRMADYFGVKINLIEVTLTLYFLGFAAGNFFGGPLSDSFGRKNIALTGVVLYGLSALFISLSTRIEYVWFLRFTQAFGGGFASVTTMVFVRDWFEGRQVARMATLIGMIMMIAPLIAPVIGSVLSDLFNWQTIFYFQVFYSVVLFVTFLSFMPESRSRELITKKITVRQFIGKYRIFFGSKRAVFLLLTLSSSVAGMFTFITGSSFMYIEYYGIDASIFPVLFASNIMMNVMLSLWNTRLLKKFEPEKMLKMGLAFQFIAGAIFFVSTLMFAHPFFWVSFLCAVVYMGSLGLIFGNGTAIILNLLPEISGSANAMIGVSRFFFSFVTGLILAVFHTGDLIPLGIIMFSCTLIANGYFFFFKKEAVLGLQG